ncbi:hypothetical protein [Oceanobacillus polygoni]|uniref:SunI/YnzG family protein n=1 Tax=Oceanobacillus polygoni TaxID=1235259 RepID=UPI001FD9E5EE|nr:hypothetical protein [Oceanobacillus polygoni]
MNRIVFEVKVTKEEEHIVFKWQLQKVKIPIPEIIDVTNDETYAGEDKTAIRIGYPYGTTERIYIKTHQSNYIIYTSIGTMKEKTLSLMDK